MAERPPVSATQFGELQESHSTLEGKHVELTRRFDKQDRKLLDIETQGRLNIKQTDDQGKELLLVKQSANRTEAKVDKLGERSEDLLSAVEGLKKAFLFFEWCGKRLLPVLGTIGTIAGFIVYLKGK